MYESVIFWVLAVVSVGAGLSAVLNRSIVYSALALIVVFLAIAGFFVLNNADFLAMAQVIVYAVGLTIILLFAIMFTGEKPRFDAPMSRASLVAYGVIVAYVFAVLLRAAMFPFPTTSMSPQVQTELVQNGSTAMLGQLLFSTYALPFELASILLLVAMIGAIIIAKKTFADAPFTGVRFAVDEQSAPPAIAVEQKNAPTHWGESAETRTNPDKETQALTAGENK